MSNNKEKYFKSSKAFLSQHYDENSTISWHVQVMSSTVGADLILRDCYKRIDLNFWTDSGPYSIDTRLLKVGVMIDELTAFSKALKEAHAVHLLYKPFVDAEKHKRKKKGEEEDETAIAPPISRGCS